MADNRGSMHVAKIRRRHGDREYVSHLVRRSVRDGKRVRHETIANISKLPADAIETLTLALRGVRLLPAGEAFQITRSLPHGHVEAVLGAARRLGLERLLDREPSRERDRCMAMILARVLSPGSKLATVRSLGRSTLASELGVEGCDQDDLYAAMDWLSGRSGSSGGSRAVTWPRGSRCSMTCRPRISRVARARWRSLATRATASAGRCK